MSALTRLMRVLRWWHHERPDEEPEELELLRRRYERDRATTMAHTVVTKHRAQQTARDQPMPPVLRIHGGKG